jgi:hypothetical protein
VRDADSRDFWRFVAGHVKAFPKPRISTRCGNVSPANPSILRQQQLMRRFTAYLHALLSIGEVVLY